MNNVVICPHCHKSFPIPETLGPKALAEIDLLQKQLSDQSEQLAQHAQAELLLRKERQKFEDRQKQFELEKQRAVDAAAKEIWSKAETTTREQLSFQIKERELTIESLKKSLQDAQRKAEQGSQQLQGEVAELELEKTLRQNFPTDEITEIKKGVQGADLRQVVKTSLGNVCGTILWESKKTKAWGSDWTEKLKEDLRSENAHVPILISSVLPKDLTSGFGLLDGVWITTPALLIPLAIIIRQNLIDVARERHSAQNRGEKADLIYEYVTSHEFRNRLQAIIEVYQDMQTQITQEKTALERIWRQRESQVQKLLTHTASITGSIQGLAGATFTPIPALEI